MRKFILRLRIRFFGEPDVGNAIKSLDKAVRKVTAAAEYQSQKALDMEAMARAAIRASEDAASRAKRAIKVGTNLKNLLAIDDEPAETAAE